MSDLANFLGEHLLNTSPEPIAGLHFILNPGSPYNEWGGRLWVRVYDLPVSTPRGHRGWAADLFADKGFIFKDAINAPRLDPWKFQDREDPDPLPSFGWFVSFTFRDYSSEDVKQEMAQQRLSGVTSPQMIFSWQDPAIIPDNQKNL